MNLGILLSPGDSLEKQKQSGQLNRLVEYYLKPYSKNFKKIYLFSCDHRQFKLKLPKNTTIIPKPKLIPYHVYQFLIPFIYPSVVNQINVFRVFQTVGGLPLLFINKPFVVTYGYHYHQFAQIEKKPFKSFLIKQSIKPILNKANSIIITSTENKAYLIKKGYNSKLNLISNGVDTKLFKPGKKRDQMSVLSVGRLTYQKNYNLLIKIISHSKFRSKLKLTIIGQGPLKPKLIKLAKELQVNLKVLNPVNHLLLVKYYQKASIFALTSKIEGQPKVLFEAMACGCATLTTPFPGNIIINKKTGLIANTTKSLVNGLDVLLSNPKLSIKIGQEARRDIQKKFQIQDQVKKEIRLLKKHGSAV